MFIDTHIHESKYSPDSFASLAEIVECGRQCGLDGLCITDHDSNDIRHEARRLSRDLDYLIVPGSEVLTFEGDIVVFGVDDLPRERVSAAVLLDYVNRRGGVGISAHPFRNNNRGLGENLRTVSGLAGIEGFNGNTDLESNLLACRTAAALGIPVFGASDAHRKEEVGRYATYFERPIRSEAEFVEAVKAGLARPAICLDGGYTLLDFVRDV